jgi:hypothetical protein
MYSEQERMVKKEDVAYSYTILTFIWMTGERCKEKTTLGLGGEG